QALSLAHHLDRPLPEPGKGRHGRLHPENPHPQFGRSQDGGASPAPEEAHRFRIRKARQLERLRALPATMPPFPPPRPHGPPSGHAGEIPELPYLRKAKIPGRALDSRRSRLDTFAPCPRPESAGRNPCPSLPKSNPSIPASSTT